jgi:hypothetical protein
LMLEMSRPASFLRVDFTSIRGLIKASERYA